MKKVQIAIIGGGMIGSAIAYFLARTSEAGLISVIEPDPSYTLAATPKGTGGVRQLFSQPENTLISSLSFLIIKLPFSCLDETTKGRYISTSPSLYLQKYIALSNG